jgi:hypothetical protein
VDFSTLKLTARSHGDISGVLKGLGEDGTPRWEPRPLLTAGAEGTLDVRLSDLHWAAQDTEATSSELALSAKLSTKDKRRLLDGTLTLDRLGVAVGEHRLDAQGLNAKFAVAVAGDLRHPAVDVKEELELRRLIQDFGAPYPVQDLSLTLAATKSPDGVAHISEGRLQNRGAGTLVTLSGNADLEGEQHRLSLRLDVKQDLAHLWTEPQAFSGKGMLAATVRVDSPDGRVLHTRSQVQLSSVSVELRRAGVSVDALQGEVPIDADLSVDKAGLTVLRGAEQNPYAVVRFADQHPLLAHASFVTADKVVTPFVTISPLVGNLKIEENVFSLSQLELGMRGGRVTGQFTLDWNGKDSALQAHLRATNVLSSHGEPFDGNAAFAFTARDRNLDGRAEVLRIGSRHLLDLLDLQDPHHSDPAINRIRHTLTLGYPDKVRVICDHGFASVKVTFGGLAQFVNVDELRGIPVGALIDRTLASMSPTASEEP